MFDVWLFKLAEGERDRVEKLNFLWEFCQLCRSSSQGQASLLPKEDFLKEGKKAGQYNHQLIKSSSISQLIKYVY